MISILALVIAVVVTSYSIMVVYLTIGWIKVKEFDHISSIPTTKFSIIVPFRNEESQLMQCFQSLSKLKYPVELFEVVFVNDNSNDSSQKIIHELIQLNPNFHLSELVDDSGKKAALTLGISSAKNQVIITTDADCIFHPNWLVILDDYYQSNNYSMVISPVLFEVDSTFAAIQALDFLSLMGTTIATYGNKHPILCNGANLLFTKEVFQKVNGYQGIGNTPSGDDVLLMQKVQEYSKNSIGLIKRKEATVRTKANKSITDYLNQRIRWASKIGGYQLGLSKIFGAIVFLFNLTLLTCLLFTVVNFQLVEFFIVPFAVKCIIDFLFLFLVASHFRERKLLLYIVVTELFNLIFIPLITILSSFKSYSWKGRQY